MKNVKFKIIKLLCIFIVLITPFDVYASFWDDIGAFFRGDLFKIRTETPSSMKTSDGFFNPKIRVCRGNYTYCDDMADGDCEGVGMTYARAYVDWEAEEPKICACQVFTCYDALAKGLISATSLFVGGIAVLATLDKDYSKECTADPQCIPIPLAPGPPPFCDQFKASPEIKIVPVAASNQSFFQPKIRVIIGSQAQNLDVSTDGREHSYTIEYGGERYIFKTYKEKDQLCADFYSNSSNIALDGQCFPMPKIGKPELIPLDEEGNEIKLDVTENPKLINLDKVKVKVPGYNHNPITLAYGQEYNINGLRLSLGKPKVSDDRSLIIDANNDNGKVTCLFSLPSWGSDGYVLRRKENRRIFKYLKSSGKQFNDYRIVPIGDKDQYVPCGRNPKDLNIMGQDELDSIKRFGGSYYSIGSNNPICSDGSICCGSCICYDDGKLKTIGKGERCTDGKVCNTNYKVVYKYEDVAHKSEFFNNDPSNPEYSTKYINENTGEPFFLTKEELNDKEGEFFRPKDPYVDGLCIDNFERISYIDPKEDFSSDFKEDPNLKKDPSLEDQYHYFDAKKKQCQFVTMEAWGGGGAGFIDEKNPAKSISGAAGDYTKATIKVSDEQPIFKIKVGSGGKLEQNNGNASEVYMCDKDKKNCSKLIIAGGGGNSVSKQNAAITDENLVYTRFIGRIKGTNESDKIALPYKNGEEKDEIPYIKNVFKESLTCSNSIKSNKVKEIANDNKIPGSGGCINVDKLSYQEGANGKVIITCEQWN
ncbi:glycine-rich domain-containing protein [Candidatus Mesenet endosymbiont of Agriotes lineatus]|uniref:glycine-rich domain-containing protein n=1 Tax=Candidatus Mesenet endosymbiont of Agriotes lineatus TaxID=3077948 RepID=UPI0030CCDAF1